MTFNTQTTLAGFAEHGYVLRQRETLALASLLNQRQGVRALLIEGEPGAGKTSLGEYLAKVLDVEDQLVMYMFHNWTGDDEVFKGFDAVAAFAGDKDNVFLPGVFTRVLELSRKATPEKPVICILDELDKAPERVENLLLDVLQSGRVPTKPGCSEKIELDNVIFFLTSNAHRPLNEALLRRVRRLYMNRLPAKAVNKLVTGWVSNDYKEMSAGHVRGLVTLANKVASQVAHKEGTFHSPQELRRLTEELINLRALNLITDIREMELVVAAWAAKNPALQGKKDIAAGAGLNNLWGALKQFVKPGMLTAADTSATSAEDASSD